MPKVLIRIFAIVLLGAVMGGIALAPLAAQQAGAVSLDIAVVDVQKILRQSAASRTIRAL